MKKRILSNTRIIADANNTANRRRLVQALILASGAGAARSLPDQWARPVIDSVMLPAHAQTSTEGFNYTCSIEDFRVDYSASKTGSETEIAGTYTGIQEAAGPFFGNCQQTGVAFEQQGLTIEIIPVVQNRSPVSATTRSSSHTAQQYQVRFLLNGVLIFTFFVVIALATLFLFQRTRDIVFNGFPARETATYHFIINPGVNQLLLTGHLLATLLVDETAGP